LIGDDRATQYAAASMFECDVSGILGRPVEPGDDSCECDGGDSIFKRRIGCGHGFAISPRDFSREV
jgi:hypothetical protein